MLSLANKRIILGVTGGIAAYKGAELVRCLQRLGATVRVVMTNGAQEFITPLTMQALSGNPVHTDLLDTKAEAGMGHIELARWADMILVAPATANFIASLASGMGHDLLSTLCLATASPVAVAPAMNQQMWSDQSTQTNLDVLRDRGSYIIGPAEGGQACGDVGMGRLMEPQDIADAVANTFDSGCLQGMRVVITAGPTREALDPVRYISNHSSGKMGYALAQAAIDAGAEVTLISGPVNLDAPDRVSFVPVVSADDMYQASLDAAVSADIFIGAAAVADFRPISVAQDKMKKGTSDTMVLELIKNPDIIASVAELGKEERPFVVGFAAETSQVEEYATKKLAKKNLDMIVANDVSNTDIGFNSNDNAVMVFTRESRMDFSIRSKTRLACDLIEHIADIKATTDMKMEPSL